MSIMDIIVLTGGIASGKSTVARYLVQQGYPVIDTDAIAKRILDPDQAGYQAVVDHFSRAILDHEARIDRMKLADLVFNDEEERQALNQIVHPLVRKEVEHQLQDYRDQKHKVFVDVPLYYEVNFNLGADQVWLVYVDPHTQLKRLMKRNQFTKEEALNRIHSQWPIDKKRDLADIIIDNRTSLAETYLQVDQALGK